MNGIDINQILSKKMGIGIITLFMLAKVNAPPICLMVVGIVAIIMQGILDYKKNVQQKKEVQPPD